MFTDNNKRRQHNKISLGDTISIIINNALPVIGMLFLGWEVAPIIFLYWLDGELCILELIASIMEALSKEKNGLFPKTIKGIKLISYYIITFLIISIIVSIPAILAGVIIYKILNNYEAHPFKVIFAQSSIWYAIVINVLTRGLMLVRNFLQPFHDSVKNTAEEKYTLFAYRFIIMFLFSNYFIYASRIIFLYIFVVFIAALFAYSELRPDHMLHIATYYSRKQLKNKQD